MTMNVAPSVADVLERELESTMNEWLRQVNLLSILTKVSLSDSDRAEHLPELYRDLIVRLRVGRDLRSAISIAATSHGQVRRAQGYFASMLVEESRLFQVSTFQTLHLHQRELDADQVFLDIIAVADEVDAQLTETVRSLMEPELTEAA